MEPLGSTVWDVVISGTGLQQSLLVLGLSRSDKKILHIDPNEYYGGHEAALSLKEAEEWAVKFAQANPTAVFASANLDSKPQSSTASTVSSRAYALSLSPQLIHTRSELLSQLVSSRAYRQLDFLAVGSFFVLKPASNEWSKPTLTRIPSTREDVFSDTSIPARSKRQLMKFLKFVLEYEGEQNVLLWQHRADELLADFLQTTFRLDEDLRTYVLALTLTLDGKISVKDGLAMIYRHLTSFGVFGPGFAAVYPKWGGGSELAQVACRAGAVGGATYMLGTGISKVNPPDGDDHKMQLELSDGTCVKTKLLVRGCEETSDQGMRISRLVAIVGSPLSSLFETVVEGAPTPAVAVLALAPGSILLEGASASPYPVYVVAHSSDTGECPVEQTVLYFTTLCTTSAAQILQECLSLVQQALGGMEALPCLYQLSYEQAAGTGKHMSTHDTFEFPIPPVDLTFRDASLDPVYEAWKVVMGTAAEGEHVEYMKFSDREGNGDDVDDVYA